MALARAFSAAAPVRGFSTSARSRAVHSAFILSRAPTLLREPTKLESAVYTYNQKLNRHLAVPFNKDFYFKPGSAAELAYLKAEKERVSNDFRTILSRGNVAAANVAATPPAAEAVEGSKEELVSSDKPKEANPTESVMDTGASTSQEASAASDSTDVYTTRPRRTEADEANDTSSLDRAGDRTLYLVVKPKGATNSWRFPSDTVDLTSMKVSVRDRSEDAAEDAMKVIEVATDTLHAAAPRAVTKAVGELIDVWLLTNMPVGHAKVGKDKTYFLAGHVIAGNADKEFVKETGISYAWLKREEIEEALTRDQATASDKAYYGDIAHLLNE